ncbi:MAG: (d)CMP kinase [Planctomycetes bacterium]|nr:(d)CMP kinase [Planctomycetota bacterium]
MQRTVVAIDGPAGAGKTTVARALAARLGFTCLPSGTFYRALGWRALEAGTPLDDEAALAQLADATEIAISVEADGRCVARVDGRDVSDELGSSAVGEAASRASVFPEVRRRMVELQRRFAEDRPVVAEGRDMATVVFADAEHKFYLDATVEERARRRARDLRARGEAPDERRLANAIAARDRRDSSREAAPLRLAEGAVRVDTTGLSVEEVVERLLRAIRSRPESV